MKKRIKQAFLKIVILSAMMVSTVFVNATCSYKLYQEKLPDELERLRKNA